MHCFRSQARIGGVGGTNGGAEEEEGVLVVGKDDDDGWEEGWRASMDKSKRVPSKSSSPSSQSSSPDLVIT